MNNIVYGVVGGLLVGFASGWHINDWRLTNQIQELELAMVESRLEAEQNLSAAYLLGNQLSSSLDKAKTKSVIKYEKTKQAIQEHANSSGAKCDVSDLRVLINQALTRELP